MQSLADMRCSIDNIDNAILAMLAERFKVTQRVGLYKLKHNISAQDLDREAEQFQRISGLAQSYGLDAEFAAQLFSLVIKQVVENHKTIASGDEPAV